MSNTYKIVPYLLSAGEIRIHPEVIAELGFKKDNVSISFGLRNFPARLIASELISKDELVISNSLINYLGLPSQLRYEIIKYHDELIIGPFIGILAYKTSKEIDNNVIGLLPYLKHYPKINGAVLALYQEGVSKNNRLMDGYLYNPDLKRWQRGLYPYPAAIFKTIELDQDWTIHFKTALGNSIFNSKIYDRWESYDYLSLKSDFRKHMPDTKKFTINELVTFIKAKKDLLLLPKGNINYCIRVYASEKHYKVYFRTAGKTIEKILTSHTDLAGFIGSGSKDQFIMQQKIQSATIDNKSVDFRVILTKNEKGLWEQVGFFARYGRDNFLPAKYNHQLVVSGLEALKVICNNDQKAINKQYDMMLKLSMKLAQAIEVNGENIGNLGIDFVVGDDGRLWIIDVSLKDPDHGIAVKASDFGTYHRAIENNMLYAKYLAGFINQ